MLFVKIMLSIVAGSQVQQIFEITYNRISFIAIFVFHIYTYY